VAEEAELGEIAFLLALEILHFCIYTPLKLAQLNLFMAWLLPLNRRCFI
jgi:hypothetical protein